MPTSIPTNPDALLTRDQNAAALTEAGYPITTATLATKATRGGGPAYQLFGKKPLYRWGVSLAWAQSRLSAPRRSTSEVDNPGRPGCTSAEAQATVSGGPPR